MWDLTGVCLLFTCMTDSTVRLDRFVCSIYMYGRLLKAVSLTHILIFSHAVTWSQKQVGGWETIPKNLEKKPLSQNSSSNSSPLPCEENDCDKECYNINNPLILIYISMHFNISIYIPMPLQKNWYPSLLLNKLLCMSL